jgi:predicted methyltransferase
MTRTIALLLAASAALSAPALAQQTSGQPESGEQAQPSILDRLLDRVLGPAQQPETAQPAEQAETQSRIDAVLAASVRDEDRARDRYRHPAETLAFFRVTPGLRVAEYSPGGGWYTRVLAPYLAGSGSYHAVNPDSSARELTEEQRARVEAWPRNFSSQVQLWGGVFANPEMAFESDEIPERLIGTFDRVLIFRNIHSMLNGEIALSELRNIRRLLADDGLVGVVQHRAPEGELWERANGSRGYVKQSDVIALFDLHGFELVGTSEINANPNDPANWGGGVWTLPPVLANGDENRSQYLAVGESDRMTLLFRKTN